MSFEWADVYSDTHADGERKMVLHVRLDFLMFLARYSVCYGEHFVKSVIEYKCVLWGETFLK